LEVINKPALSCTCSQNIHNWKHDQATRALPTYMLRLCLTTPHTKRCNTDIVALCTVLSSSSSICSRARDDKGRLVEMLWTGLPMGRRAWSPSSSPWRTGNDSSKGLELLRASIRSRRLSAFSFVLSYALNTHGRLIP
jgi:hypothetical protein